MVKLTISSTVDKGLRDKSKWVTDCSSCDTGSPISSIACGGHVCLCVRIENTTSEDQKVKVSYTLYKSGKYHCSDTKTKTIRAGKTKQFFSHGIHLTSTLCADWEAKITATIVHPECQETCETTCQTFCMALCEGGCESSCQCSCESTCESEIENTDFPLQYEFELPSGLSGKAKFYVAKVYSCQGWSQTGTFCYRTRAFFGEGGSVRGCQFKRKIAIQNNTQNDMTLQIIEDGESDSSCVKDLFYQYPRPLGSITVKAGEITTKEFNPYGLYHDQCTSDRPTYLKIKWKLTRRRTPPCENYGDLNDDGYIDDTDLVLLGDYLRCGYAQISTPLSESEFIKRADLDQDGSITATDFTTLSCFIAHETDTFPVCKGCGNCETTCQTTCEGTSETCTSACLTESQEVCGYCETSCQDTCEIVCQSSCEASCQEACEVSCQTVEEQVSECEETCQVTCQTECLTAIEKLCLKECQTVCETGCQLLEEIECPIMVVSYGTPLVDSLEPLRRIRKILPSLILRIYYSDLHLKIARKLRRFLYLPLLLLTKLLFITKRH